MKLSGNHFSMFFLRPLFLVVMANFTAASLQGQDHILNVPADYPTITRAVENAGAGDTIILAPGTYHENSITINKKITISSRWILTGDTASVESTIINCDEKTLFSVKTDGVEISGLKIINGNHPLENYARAVIKHNHLVGCKDAVSMETNGGGYIGYNLIENSGDDGIDLDISKNNGNGGSDILIEYNTIVNSHDDGIEIRLFEYPDQNIHYEIRHNTFISSRKAGVQLISYDVYTGKVFSIHHNVFRGCITALGCMGGSNTSEDLSGTSKMDERVYFYNNTVLGNTMGATGGNNIIAINNIISSNSEGGFKRFGKNAVIVNNLFYHNNGHDFIEISDSARVRDNILGKDPDLDKNTLVPVAGSPCVDAGLQKLIMNDITVLEIPPDEYSGTAPDIGAREHGVTNK